MNEQVLRLLFKIPDPITINEFQRRTGRTESSVRKLADRRRLPIRTEREINGEGFSDMRLMIMWNEWLEMIYEVTNKLPIDERIGWKASWLSKVDDTIHNINAVIQLLFDTPDPITVREFCRRTGKSESSIRKLTSSGRLPIRSERTPKGNRVHLVIMWNEWLEMVYEANNKIPSFERMGWKTSWFKRVNKLVDDLGVLPPELERIENILSRNQRADENRTVLNY
ncbi:Cox family DNA-binding protein [Xenorhabdus nematophila]|uniref:Uncharacterized protein n=1 Tax=Xenorhabdus nematophila (strain ATCC 19061 / DSM 3370 / CCUG 14189 / LMG 1036 / NCIMB 9965 / AN6) TaxID=406817 RepID=D3VKP4_XENNA|nr:Cox family DNA-binding protein [Xenorhabdus nematophila]CBJ91152.1 hypothetical protein XNC1_3098 [Xenorhabdus nematophila ATCC 19061]CEK23973.1 hypothetical protein XNC2_2979 [Xenorhabdus nematophila AN6/1]